MTAAVVAVSILAAFLLGLFLGRWLTETAHGWPQTPVPGVRRRRWQRLNRKHLDDPPGLVTTAFTDADRRRR